MQIDICPSPQLFPVYNTNEDTTIVVIDIFRATSCMCVAFEYGVNSILPIANLEKAIDLKNKGYIVAAERNAQKCDFADLGNSPFDYMQPYLKGKDILMTTTNGTQAIDVAKGNKSLLIGAFSNFTSLTDFLINNPQDTLLVCAGWNNRINLEDTAFAGAVSEKLIVSEKYRLSSDSVAISINIWKNCEKNPERFLEESEHYQRLIKQGLKKDIDFCLSRDTTHVVPFYDKQSNSIRG